MLKSENGEGVLTSSACAGKAKLQSSNNNISSESTSNPQSLNEEDQFSNNNTFTKSDEQQKRFSWLEGSSGFFTRTTASNSTEISPPNQTNVFNVFIGSATESLKRESISVQNTVFSEEDASSTTSRTQSQDFTPFFSLLKNQKNSAVYKQSEDWSSEQTLQSMSLQNNPKDELSLLEDKFMNTSPIKSETIIAECPTNKVITVVVTEEVHLNSLVLDEIKKINLQENDDETQSPTLKLRRVRAEKDNTIEQRIYRWLDINGIFQVDPTVKREEYYQQKRENLIQMKKVSKPLEDQMKQTSCGSLNLCKISSSPLFNRRKLVNKVPSKKNKFLEINDDEDQQSCNIIQNSSDQLDQDSLSLQAQKSEDIHIHKQTQNKNFKETTYTVENNIIIQVPSNQNDNSTVNVSSTSTYLNGDIFKSTFDRDLDQLQDIQEDDNNILPKKKTKIFHQSTKQSAATAFEKSNSSEQYFKSTNTEQSNQENYDFINKKPPPNLDIEKNQKRRSLKHLNSLSSFNSIGIPLQ